MRLSCEIPTSVDIPEVVVHLGPKDIPFQHPAEPLVLAAHPFMSETIKMS